jgi:hypothetical protein
MAGKIKTFTHVVTIRDQRFHFLKYKTEIALEDILLPHGHLLSMLLSIIMILMLFYLTFLPADTLRIKILGAKYSAARVLDLGLLADMANASYARLASHSMAKKSAHPV